MNEIDKEAFQSPQQRKWFFATHSGAPGTGAGEGLSRWSAIVAAAREAVKGRPNMGQNEIVGAINDLLSVTLTPNEEKRLQNMLEKRIKKLTPSPEDVPVGERTPEIYEALEQEWTELQRKEEEKKEREKEMTPPPPAPPPPTSVDLKVPTVGTPGMYMSTGIKKKDQKKYFLEKYPQIADADHWRAFLVALQLARSYVDDNEIKEEIAGEYPQVDTAQILSAVKGFLRGGSKDPYVLGRSAAEKICRRDRREVLATYADIEWHGDIQYLKGFRDGLPQDILQAVVKIV